MRYRFLQFVPFALLLIREGYGLMCYQCDSAKDADCKENFDWDHLDSLTIQPTECTVDQAKYCIKTTGVWGGSVGTQRFCSSRDMFNQCQYVEFSDHNRVYRACIYTCSGDGCNAAVKSTSTSLLKILVISFLSLIFVYKTNR
jgi:hypothetical protein